MNQRYDLNLMLKEIEEDLKGFDRHKKLSQDEIQRRVRENRTRHETES